MTFGGAKLGRWRLGRAKRARRIGAFAALLAVAAVFQLGLANAETVEAPAVVSREAYFTYPITQTTPPVLRNGFPPATACLVAGIVGVPQLCGTEVQQVAALAGLTDGLPLPITPDGDLAQPVALPGTTPVGMSGGQPRYVSLAALNLPALASGQRYGKFELVLYQDGVNFAIESPALRDVVLQLVGQVGEQDPAKISDAITRAITGEVPLTTESITGIEACAVIQPWNAGRGQAASLDGSRLPDVNCLIGTTGAFDKAAKAWVFDLTFAAQAWTEGVDGQVLDNQGIMLRPLGAPNLAYGDPDFSTNWVVSLADSTSSNANLRPLIRYTTVTDDTGAVIDPGGLVDLPASPTDDTPLDFGDAVDGVNAPSTGGSDLGDPLAVPPARTASRARTSHGSTPGWLWLVLPLALLVAFAFDEALGATPAAMRRRPGALTKLEAARAQASATSPQPGAQ
ncbi:MAG: hypothetical protein H0U92_05710 [Actinobacteria bacterium]|nr:hypothetical protein [Actinomycetota bacterium]